MAPWSSPSSGWNVDGWSRIATGGGGLILDTLTSVTPLAVYSTRKLLSAYSGHALQATSSGGGTADIGFSSNNLDNAALASFVGSNTGTVSIWYDQSGSAINATPATGGFAPTIRTSSTTLQLGTQTALNPCFAATSCPLVMTATNAGSVTVAFCFRFNSSTNWSTAHFCDGAGGSPRWLVGTGSTDYEVYENGSVGTGGTLDTTTTHTVVCTFDASGLVANLYVDNTLTITAASIAGTSFTSETVLGSIGNGALDMNIGEFMFLNNVMNSTDRGLYHTNCQTYWGSN